MTANAMSADRDRCLAVGMNDHIAKPIEPDELFGLLLKWVPAREATTTATPLLVAEPTRPVELEHDPLHSVPGLDIAAGMRRVLQKRGAYEGLLRKFLSGQAHAVDCMHKHLEDGQRDDAQRFAHTLKGTAGTIGAADIAQAAGAVEQALLADMPTPDVLNLLPAVNSRLQPFLAALQAALPVEAETVAAAGEIHWPQARALVQRLDALLADDDSDAIELFEATPALLKAALGSHYAAVEAGIKSYILVDARNGLAEAQAHIRELGEA